jgi:hypothetical protein
VPPVPLLLLDPHAAAPTVNTAAQTIGAMRRRTLVPAVVSIPVTYSSFQITLSITFPVTVYVQRPLPVHSLEERRNN